MLSRGNGDLDIGRFRVFAGAVKYVSGTWAIAARGYALYETCDGGNSWHYRGRVPVPPLRKYAAATPWTARLARSEIRHVVPGESDALLIWTGNRIYRLDAGEAVALHVAELVGGRPLVVCRTNNSVLYGEYRDNAQRTPVAVWVGSMDGMEWERQYCFDDVRHVHGVFQDPVTGQIWVTTGDENSEIGIWCDDHTGKLVRIWGGNQQFRAVHLLFTNEFIYFGSDTPRERNYLYRVRRNPTSQPERLQEVGSSIFFGDRVGDTLCFSTACEPSAINTTAVTEVWVSHNGIKWERKITFPRDVLPLKYFQYAQVRFPAGNGDGANLWMTPFAVLGSQHSYRVPIREL